MDILNWEDMMVPVRSVWLSQKPFEGVFRELEVIATN